MLREQSYPAWTPTTPNWTTQTYLLDKLSVSGLLSQWRKADWLRVHWMRNESLPLTSDALWLSYRHKLGVRLRNPLFTQLGLSFGKGLYLQRPRPMGAPLPSPEPFLMHCPLPDSRRLEVWIFLATILDPANKKETGRGRWRTGSQHCRIWKQHDDLIIYKENSMEATEEPWEWTRGISMGSLL